MKRHTMKMTSSVTLVGYGCGECEYVVTPADRDERREMAALEQHADATGHIVVAEERTTRNYVSKTHERVGVNSGEVRLG